MASACTLLSAAVVIMRRCTSEMRPCGNSTTTSTWARPRNASTAAPPVSPDVATTMVVRSARFCSTWSISRARNCIARSLKASVGPWNSSSTNRLGPSWISGTFRHPATVPLIQLGPSLFVLELFHGPTLAFKDLAMQFLARLMDHVLQKRAERTTIVVATSGDTGGAAVEAFRGRAQVDVVVLFPHGR